MKKLTAGEVNLMKEFGIANVDAPTVTTRTNPWSGESIPLNAAAANVYDTIKAMEYAYETGGLYNGKPFKVQSFDRLRMLFLKFWGDAYKALLD